MAYNNESNKTAERIFVCGGLNAGLHSGQVSLKPSSPDQVGVEEAVNILRAVWVETFGIEGALGDGTDVVPLPKKDARGIYEKLQTEVREAVSRQQLSLWWDGNAKRIQVLPEDWQEILRTQAEEKMGELANNEVTVNAV